MTTIACDGESMAGDGMLTANGTIWAREFVKVHQLKDGRVVGISGSAFFFDPFIAWLNDGGELDELGEDFEALVLSPDGVCRSYDYKGRSIIEELPTASGSGKEIALGAMVVGATPEEAVQAASERDMATGGKITVLTRPRKLRRVA